MWVHSHVGFFSGNTTVVHKPWLVESADAEPQLQRAVCKVTRQILTVWCLSLCCSRVHCSSLFSLAARKLRADTFMAPSPTRCPVPSTGGEQSTRSMRVNRPSRKGEGSALPPEPRTSHRHIRVAHGLDEGQRVHGGRADGVGAAQVEHAQGGALVGGARLPVDPGWETG